MRLRRVGSPWLLGCLGRMLRLTLAKGVVLASVGWALRFVVDVASLITPARSPCARLPILLRHVHALPILLQYFHG